MLAVLGGNSSPKEEDVTKILESVGVEVENETLSKLMKELEGKDVFEVMTAGKEKLASVPSGGVAAGGGGDGAAAEGGAEEKKEEKEEEEEAEEEEEMDFDLFD